MAYYGESDIVSALVESGVEITIGGTTVQCLLDTPDHLGLDESELGGIVGAKVVATILTGSLPELAIGALAVVDGVNHYVRKPLKQDDGALTMLLLSRAAPEGAQDVETPTSWVGNDVPFILDAAAAGLPNARVLNDSGTVEVDRSEVGIARLKTSGRLPITEPAVDYLATASDHTINCTAPLTVTLPPIALLGLGKLYLIKNSASAAVTIIGDETIDGDAQLQLPPKAAVSLQAATGNWIVW